MATLPQIDGSTQTITKISTLPSKTYKLILNENGPDRIIGYVDKLDAVRQSVYHILNTERYAYDIYDNNYGVELQQYIGQGFDYLVATIEQTLREALMQDLRITNVVINVIYKVGNDQALVACTVESIYGNLQMEVSVNV